MKFAFFIQRMESVGGHSILKKHIEILKESGHRVDLFVNQGEEGMRFSSLPYNSVSEGITIDAIDFDSYDKVSVNGYVILPHLQNRIKNNFHYFQQTEEDLLFPKLSNLAHSLFPKMGHYSYAPWLLENIKKEVGDTVPYNHVPTGVYFNDLHKFYNEEKEDKVVFMVGYYRKIKGIQLAQQVFSRLKERGIKTVLISPYENIFGADEHIINPDFDTKMTELNKCGVMLHTSISETWSITCVEAMSVGVPVVGTNSKGIMTYCTDKNSKIIDERITEKVTNNVIEVLQNRKKYTEECINTGRMNDWSNCEDQIRQFYEG